MSFSVRLNSDSVLVEPGINTPLSIEVANRRETEDRFDVQVEGLDPDWTAIPVPIFSVGAGEVQTEKVFFKPPRASESIAGNYPFVVRVRSLETGEARTAQGILQIKPYHHLSMEILPKKGLVSPLSHQNEFTVTLVNLGNSEHTMQLFGSDPEDACTYEFGQEQIPLGPGQQKEVVVTPMPHSSRPFANSRLHGFTISARSVEVPSLVASAQAQLEQRPLLSVGALLAMLVLALVLTGLWVTRPKPPVVDSLTLDRSQALVGDHVTATWRTTNASKVQVRVNGVTIVTAGDPDGSIQFPADQSGTVEVIALRDSRSSKPEVVTLEVRKPPVAPDPQITQFDISPREVPLGQSFMMRYKLANVVKATLAPTGQVLDPKLDSLQIRPDSSGDVNYYIVAENASGKTVKSKTIRVRTVNVADVRVVVFRAEPGTIDLTVTTDATVRIIWQLTNAARAELYEGSTRLDVASTVGEITRPIFQTTTYTLRGYDAEGMTVEKKLTVTVKEPPPPDDPPTTTITTTGGTTGTTGTTGATGGTTGTSGGATTGTTGTGTTGGRPTTGSGGRP
ncbi:MAG TPA: hypothetical protein VEX38_09500 [Fimbriimonadaceae bacterium]|nr:hypothetical protein [Fimbriimonadaceae bacterium]